MTSGCPVAKDLLRQVFCCLLLCLVACDQPPPTNVRQVHPVQDVVQTRHPPPLNQGASEDPEVLVFDALSGEARTQYFLRREPERQVVLAQRTTISPANLTWTLGMLGRDDIARPAKEGFLDSLAVAGEPERRQGFSVVLASSDRELVLYAVDLIWRTGDEADIPLLAPLATGHADQEVREAASDAIEMLKP